jgi:hypothetical protein
MLKGIIWFGVPLFLLGSELQRAGSVRWAWALWLVAAGLTLAADEAYRGLRLRREVARFDRELRRYQRHDREDSLR